MELLLSHTLHNEEKVILMVWILLSQVVNPVNATPTFFLGRAGVEALAGYDTGYDQVPPGRKWFRVPIHSLGNRCQRNDRGQRTGFGGSGCVFLLVLVLGFASRAWDAWKNYAPSSSSSS